jgi:crossover junction endodeoxyribonuclease RuvC
MVIVGVDPSTVTGVAVVSVREKSQPKITLAKELTTTSREKGIDRAIYLAEKLQDIFAAYNPDLMVIEGYGFGNNNTLVTLAEIGTLFRYKARKLVIPFIEVPPTSLKKFITGNGGAKKDHILLEVYKRWDVEAETNNIADAIGLAFFGAAAYGLIDMPKRNIEAVAMVTKKGLPNLADNRLK